MNTEGLGDYELMGKFIQAKDQSEQRGAVVLVVGSRTVCVVGLNVTVILGTKMIGAIEV